MDINSFDDTTANPSDQRGPAVRSLPVGDIERNPYQPRTIFNEIALQELSASIRQHGVLQPIIVRAHEGRYQLVSGERRLLASKRAGIRTIPAVVRAYDDEMMLEIAIVENLQREGISPLEAARAYKRLIEEFGLTQELVALRVGKSRPAISNTLRLLKLPQVIQNSLERGDISEGHARSLLSISDPEWQLRAWEQIIQSGLSVRDTERISSHPENQDAKEGDRESHRVSRETTAGTPSSAGDPDLRALEDRLRVMLGTRVRIRGNASSGSIIVDYYDEQDLQRLADLLGLS
jgi:ParB family chromosome partitioning protein